MTTVSKIISGASKSPSVDEWEKKPPKNPKKPFFLLKILIFRSGALVGCV